MKYASLKKKPFLKYKLPTLNGGINDGLLASTDKNYGITECENMWYKKGALTTRKGFTPALQGIINDQTSLPVVLGPVMSDFTCYQDENPKKLVYLLKSDRFSQERLYLFWMDKKGNLTSLGNMKFQRISDEEFYAFKNVFFVQGSATKGCGIYAFVTLECRKNGALYDIYELSLAQDQWIKLCDEDFYVPVVYINGRGNCFDRELYGNSFPEILIPEKLNMLCGRFKAYFSSDELSDGFKLPYNCITEDSTVVCRVYFNSVQYAQWIIPKEAESVKGVLYTAELTVQCDRKNGIVYFKDGDGNPFPVPKMPSIEFNNIVITATANISRKNKIIGSKEAVVYDSDVYLYGSDAAPSEIYSAKLSNPLYFPENCKAFVGNTKSKIVKGAVQQNKLIVFKEDGIYRINVGKNTADKSIILLDDEYNLLLGDTLSTTPIHEKIGCVNGKTVVLCGNKLVWLGSGNKLYVLSSTTYGKKNNICEISKPIEEYILGFSKDLLENAFGVEQGGYYMLFVGGKVYVMNYEIRNFGVSADYLGTEELPRFVAWYQWQTPDGIACNYGVNFEGELLLGCVAELNKIAYICLFSGDTDSVILSSGEMSTPKKVEGGFVTEDIYFDSLEELKNIEDIFIEYKSEAPLWITAIGDNSSVELSLPKEDTPTVRRIGANLRGVNRLRLRLRSNSPFTFRGGTVYYQKTNIVR